jgi:hypothetical protein
MIFWPPTHGILNPLSMVYWTLYPWYFDPLPMVFWPPTHGILTPLSMVFWPPLSISSLEIRGFKIPYREGSVFNKGGSIYYGWKLTPGSIYHGGQNTIWHRYFVKSMFTFCSHSINSAKDNFLTSLITIICLITKHWHLIANWI